MLLQQDKLTLGPSVIVIINYDNTIFRNDKYEIVLGISLKKDDGIELIRTEFSVNYFINRLNNSLNSLEECHYVLETLIDKDILQYKDDLNKVKYMHKHTSFDLIEPGIIDVCEQEDNNYKKTENLIELPNPKLLKFSLQELLNNRHSSRDFGGIHVKLDQLSTLLWGMYGVNSKGNRTVASAGGVYPLSLYIYNKNIDQLKEGLYEYIPNVHKMRYITDKQLLLSEVLLTHNINYDQCSALIIICGKLDIICKRYSERGYRYLLVEAGLVSQNLTLVSENVGIDSIIIGGFDDTLLSKYLDLNKNTCTLISVVIGKHEENR